MDLLEKIDMFLGEGSNFKKFDDVLIKSKNKSGMIYSMSGQKVVVKTVSGLINTTIDDLKLIGEGESEGKSFPALKKKSEKSSAELAQDAEKKQKDMEIDAGSDDEGEDPYDPETDLDKEKKQKALKKKANLHNYTPAYQSGA